MIKHLFKYNEKLNEITKHEVVGEDDLFYNTYTIEGLPTVTSKEFVDRYSGHIRVSYFTSEEKLKEVLTQTISKQAKLLSELLAKKEQLLVNVQKL